MKNFLQVNRALRAKKNFNFNFKHLFVLLAVLMTCINTAWGSLGSTEIIKNTITAQKTCSVTGTMVGSGAVNGLSSSSPYKLNSNGAYVSLVLSTGKYYAEGDSIIIDASKAVQIYTGAAGSGSLLATTDQPVNGTVVYVLPSTLPSNTNSLYVYRASDTYNATLTYVSVRRPNWSATGAGKIGFGLSKASSAVNHWSAGGLTTVSSESSSFSTSNLSIGTNGKDGYCGDITGQPASENSSYYVSLGFSVDDGYTFNPSEVGITLFANHADMRAKVEISDGETTVTSNEWSASASTDASVTFASGAFTDKLFSGDVTIKIYSYNKTGKKIYIKSPITITGTVAVAATCSSAYSFHYGPNGGAWETPICFEQVGSTHEWNITNFTIPDHTNGEFWVGYEGSTNEQSVTKRWTDALSDLGGGTMNGAMVLLPTNGSVVGPATGATGTLVIWDNSGSKNQYVGFRPDGYSIKYSSTNHPFTETATANVWETELLILPNCTTTYTMEIKTASGYTTCYHSKAAEALSAPGNTMLKNGKKYIYVNAGIWHSNVGDQKLAVWDAGASAWGNGGDFLTWNGTTSQYEGYVSSSTTTIVLTRIDKNRESLGSSWGDNVYNKTADITLTALDNEFSISNSDWGSGTTPYTARAHAHPATGDVGKFRMYDNSNDNNWYVHWVPYYELSYDANGGTGSVASSYGSSELSSSTHKVAANSFTREGWTFTGWNTEKHGKGTAYSPGANIDITGNTTLYAQWKKTVYFKVGAGWDGSSAWYAIYCFDSENDSDPYRDWVRMNTAASSCETDVFKGDLPGNGYNKLIVCRMDGSKDALAWDSRWNQTGNISYDELDDNDQFTPTSLDGNSCAGTWSTYSIPTFTISYAGGTASENGSKSDETKTCNVDFTLPSSAVFTRSGYTQTGWTTSDGDSQTHELGGSYTTDAAQTFYPVWTPKNYSITYKDQGDVAFSGTHETGYPTSHTYGSATALKKATKDNYAFAGWYTTSTCTGDAITSIGATAYSSNITLYARWVELDLHEPGTYEAPTSEGGYGRPLRLNSSHDYEVYYVKVDSLNGSPDKGCLYAGSKLTISDGYSMFKIGYQAGTEIKSEDGWVAFKAYKYGGSNGASCNDAEFKTTTGGKMYYSNYARLSNAHYVQVYVQGYDEFAFEGRDYNTTGDNFVVKIDGVTATPSSPAAYTPSTSRHLTRYSISANEPHLIEVLGNSAANENKFQGFSLRLPDVTRYTVSATNTDGYGSVDVTSISNVRSGSTIYTSSNTLTVGGTKVTATENSSTAQYSYAFNNWTKGDGTALPGTVTGAITVRANFTRTPVNYTLAWDKNGGSTLTGTYTTGSTGYGTAITKPNDPTRDGYTFTGWNTEDDGSGDDYTGTMPAANTTYYAQWEEEVCTPATLVKTVITGYESSAFQKTTTGTYAGTPIIDLTSKTSQEADLDSDGNNEIGYKMDGSKKFYVQLSGTTLQAGDIIKVGITQNNDNYTDPITSSKNVLILCAYDGSIAADSIGKITSVSAAGIYSYTVTAADITRCGDTIHYVGLARSRWGQNPYMHSIEVYRPCPSSYDVNIASLSHGEITASPESGASGDEVTLTVTPDTGYELDELTVTGETTSGTVSTTDNGDGTFTFEMPDEDVTVEATFTASEYTLTWDFNGGGCIETAGDDYTASGSVNYGTDITFPSDLSMSKPGYKFTGWSDGTSTYNEGDDYMMPNEDVEFTAQWESFTMPNVSGLDVDAGATLSSIPLSWSIPGICDLKNVEEPIFTPDTHEDGTGEYGTLTSSNYTGDGDFVTAVGTMPQYGQFGVGFDIPATTNIEWISFDHKGTLASGDHLWGGVCDASHAYWHFEDPMTLNTTSTWSNTGELYLNCVYWGPYDSKKVTNPITASVSQVSIYANTAISGGSSGTFYVRNVRYHTTGMVDIDHVVLMRKEGSAATGPADPSATKLYEGTSQSNKSHYTDNSDVTGKNYYYTVFAVHANGAVSTGVSTSLTLYTITYNAGANGSGTVAADKKTHGIDFTLSSSTFERDGFTQDGWSTSDGGDKVYELGATYSIDAVLTLYPHWVAVSGPVITNGNPANGSIAVTSDGSTPILSAVTGSTVYIAATPSTGYNFTSWDVYKTDESGTKVSLAGSTASTTFEMPAYAVTVNASFSAKTYTVTLNGNGGSGNTANVTATYGSSSFSSSITNPTKTGYIFDGWYSGEGGTGSLIINSSGVLQSSTTYSDGSGNWANDGAVTLYAKWSRDEKTAKWGLTFNAFPDNSYDTRENITITTTKTSSQDGSGEVFYGNQYYNFGDDEYIDINLASGYYLTDVTYSVHFDPWRPKGDGCEDNDGCNDVDTRLYINFSSSSTYSTSTVLNAEPIALTGNSNGDVSTKYSVASIPSGAQSARIFAEGSFDFGGDLFYLAVERTAYDCTPSTVSFDGGDATLGSAPLSREVCGEFTLPSSGSLVYPGYLFSKWNDGEADYNIGDSYTVTGDVTFTAQWVEDNTSLRIPGSVVTLNRTNDARTTGSDDSTIDIDGDGNADDGISLAGNKYVEWDVYITPGMYNVKSTLCVPSWGIEATVTLIDPAGVDDDVVLLSTGHSSGAQDVYKRYSVTKKCDFTGLVANKRYIVRAEDLWAGGSSKPRVKDVVFTPLYDVTITADPDGYGDVDESSLDDVVSGTAISASSNVLTIGATEITATPTTASAEYTYSFSNWTKGDGTALPASVTSDLSVRANFSRTANNYTLTWDLNGGKVSTAGTAAAVDETEPSGSVTYNTALTAPVVTKSSYDFAGWTPSVADNMPAANTTYTAQWAERFTVTYNAMTGSVDPTSATGSTANKVSLPEPTKDGYDFDGWYNTAGEKIGDAGDEYGPTAAITLYAKWKGNCSESTIYTMNMTAYNSFTESTSSVSSITNSLNSDAKNTVSVGGKDYYKFDNSSTIRVTYNFEAGDKVKFVLTANQDNKTCGVQVTEDETVTNVTGSLDKDRSDTLFYTILTTGNHAISFKRDGGDNGSNMRFHGLFITRASGCKTVTYHGNGATSGYVNDPRQYTSGANPEVLDCGYTRTGYAFMGWADGTDHRDAGTVDYQPGNHITSISDDVTLYAIWKQIKYFTGAASTTSWNTDGNWSPSGVPAITDPVVIQANVTVDINNAKALRVDIETGNTLTINAGQALIIEKTLTKAGGATAATDVIINSTRAAGTGALIIGGEAGTNQATVNFETKVKRESGTGNWINQFIGSPFSDLEPYVDYALQIYAFKADGSGNRGYWHSLSEGNEMEEFVGHNILYNDNDYLDVQWTGTLNASSNEKTLTGYYGLNTYSLFANSWVAPIHIGSFESTDFANMDATIYIFNAGTPQQEKDMGAGNGAKTDAGTYAVIPISSGEWIEGTLDVIPAMQAFFVKANAASPSLTLDYSKLVYTPALTSVGITPTRAPRRATAEEAPEVIRLRVAGENGWAETTYLLGREDFTEGFDNGWDGRYMEGEDTNPQLYAPTGDGNMAVNCVPQIEGTVLGFRKGNADSQYTFSFEYAGEEEYYLKDLKLDIETRIDNESTYAFTAEAGDNAARFIIVRKTPAVATGVDNVDGEGAKVRKLIINDKVYIIRGGQIYSVDGALVR